MNYEYDKEVFYEITFPTRDVPVALFRPSDIRRIKEKKDKNSGAITTEIYVRKSDNTEAVYYYDGELEEFKKHCKKVYL